MFVSKTKRGLAGARADIIVYQNAADKEKRRNAALLLNAMDAAKMTIISSDLSKISKAVTFRIRFALAVGVWPVFTGKMPTIQQMTLKPDRKIVNGLIKIWHCKLIYC